MARKSIRIRSSKAKKKSFGNQKKNWTVKHSQYLSGMIKSSGITFPHRNICIQLKTWAAQQHIISFTQSMSLCNRIIYPFGNGEY